jgi:hypothetical protein
VAGWYEFALLVDGELVAQRRLRVYQFAPEQPGDTNGQPPS